jgi:peptidoglycan/LPS O-acetylase OafA/YrhL
VAQTEARLPANFKAHHPSPRLRPRSGQHLEWLDALKGVAILAVVLDHAFIIDNYLLWKHLYFAVSWFVFLAGVSNAYSARRRGFDVRRDALALWSRRFVSLFPPYLSASALAYLVLYLGRVPTHQFLRDVAIFHTLPPLYFIALLLQLLTVFPLLFALLHKTGWGGRLVVAATVVPVAAVLSQRITFPWVLGAHYLLGASFLYLFALGIGMEPLLTGGRARPLLILLGCLPLAFWAERVNVATNGMLMTHPPSNVLLVYAMSFLGLAYAACQLFAGSAIVRGVAWLGHRSLDVFVYHYLFLLPIFGFRHTAWTNRIPLVWSQALLMAAAVPLAIIGSLITAKGVSGLGELIVRCARLTACCLARPRFIQIRQLAWHNDN